jgi:hypothetical protein
MSLPPGDWVPTGSQGGFFAHGPCPLVPDPPVLQPPPGGWILAKNPEWVSICTPDPCEVPLGPPTLLPTPGGRVPAGSFGQVPSHGPCPQAPGLPVAMPPPSAQVPARCRIRCFTQGPAPLAPCSLSQLPLPGGRCLRFVQRLSRGGPPGSSLSQSRQFVDVRRRGTEPGPSRPIRPDVSLPPSIGGADDTSGRGQQGVRVNNLRTAFWSRRTTLMWRRGTEPRPPSYSNILGCCRSGPYAVSVFSRPRTAYTSAKFCCSRAGIAGVDLGGGLECGVTP